MKRELNNMRDNDPGQVQARVSSCRYRAGKGRTGQDRAGQVPYCTGMVYLGRLSSANDRC